jgi:membrane protein DedA with SNARE-associated domain
MFDEISAAVWTTYFIVLVLIFFGNYRKDRSRSAFVISYVTASLICLGTLLLLLWLALSRI